MRSGAMITSKRSCKEKQTRRTNAEQVNKQTGVEQRVEHQMAAGINVLQHTNRWRNKQINEQMQIQIQILKN
jgi:hypothetical protein